MKRFIDKILDVPKLIRTIWLMLWIILIILLVLKFCFNQWYPIIVENEWFKRLCDYIDNNKIINYSILLFLYIINGNLIILTCLKLKWYSKYYYAILILLLNVGIFFLKYINNNLGFACELLTIAILIIICIKRNTFGSKVFNILNPIIYYLIINLWQFTIYFVRGLNIELLSNLSSLVLLILQIDYYIFITITWIGVSFMGLAGWGWLWTRDITILKAERQKELSKANPDMDKVAKIDERIAKLEESK